MPVISGGKDSLGLLAKLVEAEITEDIAA